MIDDDKPRDDAVEKELAGVPEELLDREESGNGEPGLEVALGALRADLEAAQQDMLYAKAEVQNVRRRMEKVFAQHGISRIAAVGLPLDPNQHQAMLEVPTAEAEPGTVVQEMQSGWMIRDRLLRPAMVGVAKKPD